MTKASQAVGLYRTRDYACAGAPKNCCAIALRTIVNNSDPKSAAALRSDPSITCVYTLSVVSTFECPINCAITLPGTAFSCHDE